MLEGEILEANRENARSFGGVVKLKKLAPQSNELLHLDFLRFFASGAIVFHHSHEFFYEAEIRAHAIASSQSLALFVDLFFLISGYVISHVYFQRMNSGRDYRAFMLKRIFRLVPLHWVTLAASIFMWTALAQFGHPTHRPSTEPMCIANTAALLHAVIPCGNNMNFNAPSWSISAEMCVYALFPIFVMMARRSRLVPLLISIGCVALALLQFRTSMFAFSWPDVHPVLRAIASFCLGIWLWTHRMHIVRVPAASSLMLVALGLLMAGILANAPSALLLLAVYVVGFLGVAADMSGRGNALVRRMAPFGQLTYSIYMWHSIFILVIMNGLGDKLLHLSGWSAVALGIVTYAIIATWSYVSFMKIETPARRWLEGLAQRSAVPAS